MDLAGSKVWVRSPNWVGDAVMMTPALRALRQSGVGQLVVSGRAYLAPLLEGHPHVDRFEPAPERGIRAQRQAAASLAEANFDAAVCFPDSTRAALLPALAGIPVRVGYAREPLRRALLTQALPPPRDENGRRVPISMIERFLRITRALGCDDAGETMELHVDPGARERVRSRLAAAGLGPGTDYVVVTPGASFGASKLWPPEHFASACDRMEKELGLRAVLAPGPGEEAIARAIADEAHSEPIRLGGASSGLADLVALLADARLLLTNDTGPRHIAVALSRPVVCVIGPTDQRHTAHLLERQRVLREEFPCSPCHRKRCPIDHRCMTQLAPARVVAAARELLGA